MADSKMLEQLGELSNSSMSETSAVVESISSVKKLYLKRLKLKEVHLQQVKVQVLLKNSRILH